MDYENDNVEIIVDISKVKDFTVYNSTTRTFLFNSTKVGRYNIYITLRDDNPNQPLNTT